MGDDDSVNTVLLTVHLEPEVQFPLVLAKTAYETYLVLVPTVYKNTSSYFPLPHPRTTNYQLNLAPRWRPGSSPGPN